MYTVIWTQLGFDSSLGYNYQGRFIHPLGLGIALEGTETALSMEY